MPPTKKSAIITGGASGMGLAVAESLVRRHRNSSSGGSSGSSGEEEEWHTHLFDLNPAAGAEAVARLGGPGRATFHRCDVTSYDVLASCFARAFELSGGRLDFVFANAGVAEKQSFYLDTTDGASPPGGETKKENGNVGGGEGAAAAPPPPPPPSHGLFVSKILFDSIITTSHLALHYFRLSPRRDGKSMVITASCGGIYPSNYCPVYSGAKAGNIQFMRCIAKPLWRYEGIRVNAICPGTVRTALLSGEEWTQFPPEYFTPVEKIADTVMMLVDGRDDGTGIRKGDGGVSGNGFEADGGKGGVLWGETVEIRGEKHYYREGVKFCDESMEAVMKATDITNMSDEAYREFIAKK